MRLEGLANAAKHANASRIDVSLGTNDDRLVLAIRDDGIGTRRRARIGARGTDGSGGGARRLRSPSSPPGDGTRITAELPLEPGY